MIVLHHPFVGINKTNVAIKASFIVPHYTNTFLYLAICVAKSSINSLNIEAQPLTHNKVVLLQTVKSKRNNLQGATVTKYVEGRKRSEAI